MTSASSTMWNLLERTLGATSELLDPLLTMGSGTVTALIPDAVMNNLTETVATRFNNRDIELDIAGHFVRGHLTNLRLNRRLAAFEAEIDVEELTVDGYSVTGLTVFARGIRLIPGVPTRIEADQVDLVGEIAMAELIRWVNTQGLDWRLDLDEEGLVVATHKLLEVTGVFDAEIREDLLRLQTRSGRWKSVKLPVSLMPYRAIPLGPFPNHARIVRAERVGFTAKFSVDLPTVSGKFNLRQVRDAIAEGAGLKFW